MIPRELNKSGAAAAAVPGPLLVSPIRGALLSTFKSYIILDMVCFLWAENCWNFMVVRKNALRIHSDNFIGNIKLFLFIMHNLYSCTKN